MPIARAPDQASWRQGGALRVGTHVQAHPLTMGRGQIAGGTLGLLTLVFLAFAFVNFYFAKMLKRRWEAQVRELLAKTGEQVKE